MYFVVKLTTILTQPWAYNLDVKTEKYSFQNIDNYVGAWGWSMSIMSPVLAFVIKPPLLWKNQSQIYSAAYHQNFLSW